MTAHAIVWDLVLPAALLLMYLVALAYAFRWERREKNRISEYKQRLALRHNRRDEDLLWWIHGETDARHALDLAARRQHAEREQRDRLSELAHRRIEHGDALPAAPVGLHAARDRS